MSTSNIDTGDRNAFPKQLIANSAAVHLVDHLVGLFTGVVDIDALTLKHNVVALARPARLPGVPTSVTALVVLFFKERGEKKCVQCSLVYH